MRQRLLLSMGLHSAAIIAFQLALMQLISVVQWHHFAYMIISVAMLGFGASGTVLALMRDRLLRWSSWLVPLLMSFSGLLMMLAFHITRLELFRFDAYLLFVEWSQFPVLMANYLIFFIPFFTGALAIGIMLIRGATTIGTWYFSNLLGSGLGGILFLLIFGRLFPQQLPPLIGLLSVGAGLLSLSNSKQIPQLATVALASMIAVAMLMRPAPMPLSEYKDLARTMNLPGAEVIYSQPGLFGLTEVVRSPALRYAPALSLSYTGKVPVRMSVFVRGDFYGVMPVHDNQIADTKTSRSVCNTMPENSAGVTGAMHNIGITHIHDFTTQALPYLFGSHNKVLALNAGTGTSLSHALANGASHIDAVIENRDVVRLMKTTFAEETGNLFHHPYIHIYPQEARNFLASASAFPAHNETNGDTLTSVAAGYNLILLPVQESFGGSAGINALQEDYAMTLEAFSLMWDRLAADGMIAVTTWLDYPSRASLKILATLTATARQKGVAEPANHIAAIRSWGTITFVLKKETISQTEAGLIRAFTRQMNFDPLLLPDIRQEERMLYNQLDDASLLFYMDEILNGNEAFLKDYGFMINPATDDRPYFSQFLKLKNLRQMADTFGQGQLPFLELGLLIVVVTLAQSLILALLFILLPLFRIRKSHRRKTGTLLYFAALGIGYMFVEIILIQRFVLYFGQPVYAISAVISTMLIASGAGSLLSGSLHARPRQIAVMGGLITLMLIGYAFLLTPVLQSSISCSLAWKIVISLAMIGIPSFFKGMMFPLGIRYLASYDEGQVPWAWGINGSVSVISTSLATLIAVEGGFRFVMLLAVACYLLAAIVFLLHRNISNPTSKKLT
jgi:hypothetical protein